MLSFQSDELQRNATAAATCKQGILLPAGAPPAIINRLNKEIISVLQLADVRDRISGLGADVVTSTPAQLAQHIHKELALWGRVIKQSGIVAD